MLLVIAAQAFIKTAIVVYYYANQTQIAQNWCINRNHPETTCAGKCMVEVWMKKADNSTDESAPGTSGLKNVQDLILFFEAPAAFNLNVVTPETSPAPVTINGCLCASIPKDIFHPPA